MKTPQIGEVGQYGQPDVVSGVRPQAALVLNVLAAPAQVTLVDIVVFDADPLKGLTYVRVPATAELTPGAWSALPAPELEGLVTELQAVAPAPPVVIHIHVNEVPTL
jgi:hypothetical protein